MTTAKNMNTILKLTLAAALTAGTIQTYAQQDDPLARLRAQRAADLAAAGAPAAPAEAAAPDAAPAAPAAAPAAPADSAAAALAKLRAQRAAEAGGASASATTAPAAPVTPATFDDGSDVTRAASSGYTPRTTTTLSTTNGIMFTFNGALLSDVLKYMADAAGYSIVMNSTMNPRVTVFNKEPMSKEKAVDMLNTILNQNGLAAVAQDNNILSIHNKSDAIHMDIPVIVGNDPKKIPRNDEIVTQIIPIRFVDAQQLIVDISAFVSQQAIIVANASGNSIVITDTQANIKHLAQIIQSIDNSAEMETEVQMFALKYANTNDVVAALAGAFPGGTGGQTAVGGRGGRGGGGGAAANPLAALFGGGGGGGAGSSQSRVQKAQQVLAVAEGRTQSVIVTAAKEMMPQIKELITQLDVYTDNDQKTASISLEHGDPTQVAAVLNQMFGGNNNRTTTGNGSALTVRSGKDFSTSTTSSGIGNTTQ